MKLRPPNSLQQVTVGQSEPASLLHNIGGPPMAILRWNGLGRSDRSTAPGAKFKEADRRGTWLFCIHKRVQDATEPIPSGPDHCRLLLKLIEPNHCLNDVSSKRRLTEQLEAHTQALNWPRHLIAQSSFTQDTAYQQLVIDHPLTVFVALTRSIGHLWSRDRALKLSRLASPTVTSFMDIRAKRSVIWQTSLWFPQGVPPDLLDAIRQAHDKRLEGL